jgi:hypothetical protein
MLFKAPVLIAIAEGRVTCAFRRWRRPTVRAGGRLMTPVGVLWIRAVDQVSPEAVTDEAARAAGYPSRQSLLGDLPGDAPLHLIAFELGGEDPRRAMRIDDSSEALDAAAAALARLDARRAWTRQTLALIAENPGIRAADLAARLGRDTQAFKADVRKLKALGLTESLEVGYRLSRRGEALLSRYTAKALRPL